MKYSDKEVEIIYCDNHILVANKPASMLTQPDELGSESLEDCAKAWAKKEFSKPGNVFLHAIHRLDKPVSGLVLFARTSKALSRLNEMSRLMGIQRSYVAEVEGILSIKSGQLDHYLVHGHHKALIGNKNDEGAKHARLYYQVRHYGERSTFVDIDLETGRYHQIRAQFSAIGHPIVGDERYGSKSGDKAAIHLHCAELHFTHPVSNEIKHFQTPPPFSF